MAAYNIFRLCGDLTHVVAIFLLGIKIQKTRSCSGLSLKSQLLYLLVYLSRYLDVFNGIINFLRIPNLIRYNTIMKILFLSSQSAIVYYMKGKFRATYHPALDSCRLEFLIVPSLVLAFFFLDVSSGFFHLVKEVTI
jgi:ER lumen protein retaining receptor